MPIQKPLILICDDEEGIRESFKLILEDNYELKFAKDGMEALDLLDSISPRLMLLDIKMPKMHGMDILKKVKNKKPNLPVVIVTGYQSVEMASDAIKNGAADYIPKPFETKHIQKIVAQYLSK